MSDHAGSPPHTHCRNCGTALQGHFCHRCGQQDLEFHQSFGHVFLEALENFLHFDAKFFRNVITLLFRPGRLSADFNAGRRASQMPPFRLYLFISVVFFLVRFLGAAPGESVDNTRLPSSAEARVRLAEAVADLAGETSDPDARQRLESLREKLRDPALKRGALTDEQLRDLPAVLIKQLRRELAAEEARRAKAANPAGASGLNIKINEKKDTALNRYLTEKGIRALGHEQEIREAFVHALPKMLLVCLPFFALYTRLLFRRAGQVYLQHLIVSLHYHTFVFLWWPVAAGWGELLGLWSPGLAGFVGFFTGLWMFLYPFLMLRRLFGQSWLLTSFKALALTVVYGLTLCLGFLVTALAIVMTV